MADMRLIVAGAGGRMGRTLIKAISETAGLVLAGAVETRGVAADRAGCRRARGPAAERRQACAGHQAAARQAPTASSISPFRPRPSATPRSRPKHRLVHIIGTTGLDGERRREDRGGGESPRHREVRQHEPRRQSAGRAGRSAWRRRSTKISTSKSSRCITTRRSMRRRAPRCCSAARRRKGRGIDLAQAFERAAATASPARASRATSALPRCAAARWSASTR